MKYKFDLPPNWQIHPIFHVSQLKLKMGTNVTPSSVIPPVGPHGQFQVKAVAILDQHTLRRRSTRIPLVFVQWSQTHPNDSTWEDTSTL